MLTLEIDGRSVDVPEGSSVLDAVLASGAFIPHLCQDPDQERIGACRTCVVQIDGVRGMPASCSLPARVGMAVRTSGPAIDRVRHGVLQLTIDSLGQQEPQRLGELGEVMERFNVQPGRFNHQPVPTTGENDVDESNPIWILDRTRCILCHRCVQACHHVQHIDAISLLNRSSDTKVGFFADGLIADSNCTSCGQCWATCPTLAIRLRAPVAVNAEKRGHV